MESSQIKDILYQEIRRVTDEKIQAAISAGKRRTLIEEILKNCFKRISEIENEPENFVVCAEGLTHYVLTNTLIPSQRKIIVNGVEVDIVIPDSKTLINSPKDALVLYFVKANSSETVEHLGKLQRVQPQKENIWMVSKSHVHASFKTYDVASDFATMFDDIDRFLAKNSRAKFKIFRT
jgi:hypothetical protein